MNFGSSKLLMLWAKCCDQNYWGVRAGGFRTKRPVFTRQGEGWVGRSLRLVRLYRLNDFIEGNYSKTQEIEYKSQSTKQKIPKRQQKNIKKSSLPSTPQLTSCRLLISMLSSQRFLKTAQRSPLAQLPFTILAMILFNRYFLQLDVTVSWNRKIKDCQYPDSRIDRIVNQGRFFVQSQRIQSCRVDGAGSEEIDVKTVEREDWGIFRRSCYRQGHRRSEVVMFLQTWVQSLRNSQPLTSLSSNLSTPTTTLQQKPSTSFNCIASPHPSTTQIASLTSPLLSPQVQTSSTLTPSSKHLFIRQMMLICVFLEACETSRWEPRDFRQSFFIGFERGRRLRQRIRVRQYFRNFQLPGNWRVSRSFSSCGLKSLGRLMFIMFLAFYYTSELREQSRIDRLSRFCPFSASPISSTIFLTQQTKLAQNSSWKARTKLPVWAVTLTQTSMLIQATNLSVGSLALFYSFSTMNQRVCWI